MTHVDCVIPPVLISFPEIRARRRYPWRRCCANGSPTRSTWQFDALDLRPVERWLATLPTLSIEPYEQTTITALAQPPQRLVDSYVDTDDWRMANAGFVVRTRRQGRRDEITLKTAQWAEEEGLRQPLEASQELPASGLRDLGPDGPVGRRAQAIAGRRPLRQVLEVRTRRRSFTLRIDGGDAAEIALDDTVIVVGNGQRPMHLRRVEVRVFREWMDALGPLVLQLRAACGLQPATLSKFEAGLLALGVEIPGPPDLGSTDIGPDMNLGQLAYAVLRRQLAVLRAKEPGTRLGEDPEELHDMRVATRRLRAALDLFAEVLPIRGRHFRGELGLAGRRPGCRPRPRCATGGASGHGGARARGALGRSHGAVDPRAGRSPCRAVGRTGLASAGSGS